MRMARSFLTVLVLIALGGIAVPASAQDDGIDFEDLPGLESAITRSFTGEMGMEFNPNVSLSLTLRDHLKPEVALMLIGIYEFDTEESALNADVLLRTDITATGTDGQPLPLTQVQLPLGLQHTAMSAVETSTTPPLDYTLVTAVDGTLVYTVIAITSGPSPESDVAALLRALATTETGTEPVTFNADGTSTGGLWNRVPTGEVIQQRFGGFLEVVDAAPFQA